jgi:hypothetical protein
MVRASTEHSVTRRNKGLLFTPIENRSKDWKRSLALATLSEVTRLSYRFVTFKPCCRGRYDLSVFGFVSKTG